MSKLGSDESNRIRRQYDYKNEFDIVLAATYNRYDGGSQKFDFYDSIEAIGRRVGKKIFLPHIEIKEDWDTHAKYAIPHEVVIPTSDLVVSYLDLPSESLKEMIESARIHRVPTIAFCEEENRMSLYGFRNLTRFDKEIVFSNRLEGLAELEKAVRDFYKI